MARDEPCPFLVAGTDGFGEELVRQRLRGCAVARRRLAMDRFIRPPVSRDASKAR
jgi:hypothetical protein